MLTVLIVLVVVIFVPMSAVLNCLCKKKETDRVQIFPNIQVEQVSHSKSKSKSDKSSSKVKKAAVEISVE